MQRMHPNAVKLSQLTALITHSILAIIIVILTVLGLIYDWTMLPVAIAAGVVILSGFLFVGIIPTVRAKHFAFEVDAEEVRISKGIWWLSDIVIPMVKVQHVELLNGPMMRKMDLAHVVIVTAASKHVLFGLERGNAEAVQSRIALWARVREDDV
jgi:uncharacterized protein